MQQMDLHRSTVFPSTMKGKIKGKTKRKSNNSSLKVVYISSPMKVKTSASRFRSLVQELTGRHSDVSRFMQANGGGDGRGFDEFISDNLMSERVTSDDDQNYSSSPVTEPVTRESPTSSESYIEPVEGLFDSQIEELFTSNLFYDPSRLDVLGSYDEL